MLAHAGGGSGPQIDVLEYFDSLNRTAIWRQNPITECKVAKEVVVVDIKKFLKANEWVGHREDGSIPGYIQTQIDGYFFF